VEERTENLERSHTGRYEALSLNPSTKKKKKVILEILKFSQEASLLRGSEGSFRNWRESQVWTEDSSVTGEEGSRIQPFAFLFM
jgi:hypothetical protein